MISPILKTNHSAGINCPTRIYVHILKDVEIGIIFSQSMVLEAISGFQHVYTHEKFKEVQAQFRGKVNYITRSTHSALGFTSYEIVEQVSNSTFNKFVITYDTISREVKCQCLLFESRDKVAPKYILERWSKNIKRRHTHIKSSQDEPLLEPRSKRFDDLVFRSHNICEFPSESEELAEILHRTFDNVMAEMQEYQVKSKGKSSLSHKDATLSYVNDLQSPHVLE
ncbi:hypothetical protein Ahy_B09g098716 isoform A [Arachis hypogaea]|uniref:Protein FAR1-RELATED SEQUENCE n=1 Tax=Arachis hypogaea TaxID=3818 RepID=A0A444XRW3_ARAHY|nr:hypothetical protein Ahy_B09g098716 isoform A [Arachis hypogaea]